VKPSQSGPTATAPASAQDASKFNQLIGNKQAGGPPAPPTSGTKPSAEDVARVRDLKQQIDALIRKGSSMTSEDHAKAALLDMEADRIAAKYLSPQDNARLKEIMQQQAELQQKQPMTVGDRMKLAELAGKADQIKYKDFH
jgi:hypothetical protein